MNAFMQKNIRTQGSTKYKLQRRVALLLRERKNENKGEGERKEPEKQWKAACLVLELDHVPL